MLSDDRLVEVEKATKNFMQSQYEQNQLFSKTMNEKTAMLKYIMHQLENLNREISGLQTKIYIAENRISSMSAAQITDPQPRRSTSASESDGGII